MSAGFILPFLVLAVLVALHLRARRALRFSRDFWVAILGFAALFPIGLLFGETAFFVALFVLYATFRFATRSPRIPEPGEREALRKSAYVDPKAAKRLRDVLRQDMKGHQLMREQFLPNLSPEERPAAEALIEQREQETKLQLQNLDDMIRQLKITHGAA